MPLFHSHEPLKLQNQQMATNFYNRKLPEQGEGNKWKVNFVRIETKKQNKCRHDVLPPYLWYQNPKYLLS